MPAVAVTAAAAAAAVFPSVPENILSLRSSFVNDKHNNLIKLESARRAAPPPGEQLPARDVAPARHACSAPVPGQANGRMLTNERTNQQNN